MQTLALHPEEDRLLEMTLYWEPPVPYWKSRKCPNSNLKMAVIVGDRLYRGLLFEGEMLLLTPANWKYVLRYGAPDILLIESTWDTATGHWPMAQCKASPDYQELVEIVKPHLNCYIELSFP